MTLAKIKYFLTSLLTKGLSPKDLSYSLSLGFAIGIMPFLGLTTVLCTAIALRFRLNLVVIHFANYFAMLFQVMLFVPYIKAGTWLLGIAPVALSYESITKVASQSLITMFAQFGTLLLAANFAWLLSFVPILVGLYYLFLLLSSSIKYPKSALVGEE